MKKLIHRISQIFSNNNEIKNVVMVCRNAEGELGTYCSNEYHNL